VTFGDDDPANNSFRLYLDAVVLNTNTTTGLGAAPTVFTNTAGITYAGGSVTNGTNFVRTVAIEPQVRLFKDIVQTSADAGDAVEVVLVATNTGTAAAYDLRLTDPLNTNYFDLATVVPLTIPTGYVFSVGATNVTILSDTNSPSGTNTLEPGEGLRFRFQVKHGPGPASERDRDEHGCADG